MTEQAYSDYAQKCKTLGIRPSSKEALCKMPDLDKTRMDKNPPLHICSPAKQKTEKPMAKATIIPIEQIAEELCITEKETRLFIKQLGAYPSNMTRQKVDELSAMIREIEECAEDVKEKVNSDSDIVDADVVEEAANSKPETALKKRFEVALDDDVIPVTKRQLTELYHRIREEAFAEAEQKMNTENSMSTEEIMKWLTSGLA